MCPYHKSKFSLEEEGKCKVWSESLLGIKGEAKLPFRQSASSWCAILGNSRYLSQALNDDSGPAGTEALGEAVGGFIAPMAKSVNPERKKAAPAVTYDAKVTLPMDSAGAYLHKQEAIHRIRCGNFEFGHSHR